jgi:NADPH2:quinone reductase
MKAIRVAQFGGPEVLKLGDVPMPSPGEVQVLVRLHAAGVNPVETYIRSGSYARLPPLPYTPGTDGAGVVEAVGPGVTTLKAGDRVYTAGSVSGTYAEFAICGAGQVWPLPANVSFSQGAALGVPYATAHRALFGRGQAQKGDVVLIHGASGGVGQAAVQLAKATGCLVIGTAGTEAGLALVKEQGADHVLNHRQAGYLSQINDITGGRGVHVIVEMLANVNLGRDLTVLARGGRVVVVGSRGPVEINPRETMARDADIRGMVLWNTSESELAAIHAALQAGLSAWQLRPVVAEELPLAQAGQAHIAVMQDGKLGKIVLVP